LSRDGRGRAPCDEGLFAVRGAIAMSALFSDFIARASKDVISVAIVAVPR